MKLIQPTIAYKRQIEAYRAEFLMAGDSMDGTGSLRRFDQAEDWLDYSLAQQDEETVDEGKVPAFIYVYVRESDEKIVGMVQIRPRLNDWLSTYGGHVGYSVCPTERRKGYAAKMLAATLAVCRDMGLNRVLITCYEHNEGSRRTILKNGGVYDGAVYEPERQTYIERYYLTTYATHLPMSLEGMTVEKSCGAVVYTLMDGDPRYLLIRSIEGYYGFPKGHVETGETETDTALREVREETGISVELLPGFRARDVHLISAKPGVAKEVVYFLGRYEGQTPVYQREELTEASLYTYEQGMALLAFDGVRRVLTEAHHHVLGKLNA